jgi:hypothetical protein
VRALSQMVLDQRSDIEQFFLEAMEQVKEEKRLKLEEEMQKTGGGPRQPEFLPLINPNSKYSKKASFEKSQQQQSASLLAQNRRVTVELADLDWEDRETVLRLLFSKMNTGERASCWRDPVGQSRQSDKTGSSQGGMNQAFVQEGEEPEEGLYYDEEEQRGDY